MKLIDGNKIADEKNELTKARAADCERPPALAVVMVGSDPASDLYITLKEKKAKKIGIDFHKYFLSEDATQEEVLECVSFLRHDDDIDGMIIQLPLPHHLDRDALIDAMGPDKDADGFHPQNIESYMQAQKVLAPVFPSALIETALGSDQGLSGLQAVIVGRSDLFTKAMVACATRVGMTIHRVGCDQVSDMHKVIASADVVFSACGTAGLINLADLKKDAIVVDGGIAHDASGKVVGDVVVDDATEFTGWISPVPGGVGPVTIACLLENVTWLASQKR